MALQVEIWVKSIIEGLFANNTFAARSIDHSEFVNEKTVHVPNAGAAPNVEKNRTVFPANVTERKDVDLTYQMDEFTVDPVRIPHAEQVELSYNKRESVTRQSRRKLAQDIYESIIYNWIPEGVKVVETLGEAVAAHIKEATGNRKRMTKQTVEELQTLFDEQDIPEARFVDDNTHITFGNFTHNGAEKADSLSQYRSQESQYPKKAGIQKRH